MDVMAASNPLVATFHCSNHFKSTSSARQDALSPHNVECQSLPERRREFSEDHRDPPSTGNSPGSSVCRLQRSWKESNRPVVNHECLEVRREQTIKIHFGSISVVLVAVVAVAVNSFYCDLSKPPSRSNKQKVPAQPQFPGIWARSNALRSYGLSKPWQHLETSLTHSFPVNKKSVGCSEIGVGKCCDAGDLLSLYASNFPVQPASLIQTHQNSQALFTKVASVALGIANSLKPTGTEPFPCSVKIPGT